MYLRIKGVQSGPFDIDEVAREHAAGRLDDAVMSWCDGEACWTSLGKRWPSLRPRAHPGFGMVLALLGAVGIVVASKSQLAVLPFPLQVAPVLWLVVLVLAALATLGLCWAWHAARRRGKAGLPVVLTTVLVVCFGVWGIAGAGLAGRLLQFRQHVANATVTYAAAQRAIRIQGQLGPRLEEQLRSALNAHPDAGLLVLDSPGGLVDDSLKAAAVVRAKGLVARVDGICASACVAIWAAAAQRQMTATSRLGLHQLRSDIELPQAITQVAMARLTRRYDAVLRQAGFPAAVIDKAGKTPPSSIYWLSPTDVADAGVQNIIVDADGSRLPNAMAQWLWVAQSFRPPDFMGQLMLTIRVHAPAIALRHAFDLYAAVVTRKDSPESSNELSAVYTEAKQYALLRASDADTIAWARSYFDAFGDAQRYAWMCKVDTSSSAGTSVSRAELRANVTRDLAHLLAGVGPLDAAHSWKDAYSATRERMSRHAWDAARHFGAGPDASGWMAVDWCTYKLDFLGQALQLPQPEAARAVRFIELKHWHVGGYGDARSAARAPAFPHGAGDGP
ncbi:MAG TPA: hypothetical protein VFJ87_12530 [Rhodanobacteraceae bacterium]|nr:hypothetical protein [Rhodanobacteraceae bacterium]